ncbi:FtsX-like permease family protein [Clostridium omnivorum]|uniref:ABC3 transporter permease C-terminal domain-containing protein n=1 Tax=Clostridium omnivorum TaxID=1604902 RepID=A0ABQ5N9I5_9CLOT|nr:FtsX-like permease family protein [Clostridium sp. E14]GLC31762.1 hypothetical protein bsdE14_31720 [Clostridium sp. E14]
MKKLIVRLLRDIKMSLGQFISIVLILAVGSMMFTGMFGAIKGLSSWVDNYYTDQNLADGWSYFKGISQSEIDDLSKENKASTLEGRYTFETTYSIGSNDTTLRIHSLSNINRPYIISGTVPKNDFEIIIDEGYSKANKIGVGQELILPINSKSYNFKVTGICESPEYAYKIKDSGGGPASNKTFGIAYSTKNTLLELNKNSDTYISYKDEIDTKFKDAENSLKDAKNQLSDKENQLAENKKKADEKFAASKAKLSDAKQKLDDAEVQLKEETTKFTSQTADAQKQLNTAKQTLDESKAKLDAQYAQYMLIRSTLSEAQASAKDAAFADQYMTINGKYDEINNQQQQLNLKVGEGKKAIAEKQAELNSKLADYNSNLKKLTQEEASARAEFAKADEEINKANQEYVNKVNEYNSSKNDAYSELGKIPSYYQEVMIKSSDIEAVRKTFEKNDKFVNLISREENVSYVMLQNALDPIKTVSKIFPVIFFLVAAIITLISMTKSVESDRTQIAMMKAIGISKGKIRFSYILYCFIASLLGSIGFAYLGNLIIPKILLRTLTARFSLPKIGVPFYFQLAIVTLILSFIFSGTAALIAVQRVLRESPAQGMRPRQPKKSKTILIERFNFLWKRLSYSSKLILRNIFLGKVRIILSSVGIVGSMMLLITGLSLNSSVTKVIDTSVSSIGYNLSVKYKDPIEDKTKLNFQYPVKTTELTKSIKGTLKLSSDVDTTVQLVEENSSLINLYDNKDNRIGIKENSVIIPKSIADKYSLNIGDKLSFEANGEKYAMTISDISVQYIGKSIYVSYSNAKNIGFDTNSSSLLVSTDNAEKLSEDLSKDDTVRSVDTKDNIIKKSKETINMLNTLIFIIIAAAGVLAVTVIYNITSINIFERTRELATLMVLGYYKNESGKLVFIENLVLAAIGCLGGIPLGVILFKNIINIIATNDLALPKTINPIMVSAAVLLTFVFTMSANLLSKGKIKKIVMVEALKGVE